MTRKDYVRIAAALAKARRLCETQNQRRGVERAALCIGVELAADNPRFDRARFYVACGMDGAA
jgi:hypothetical protein